MESDDYRSLTSLSFLVGLGLGLSFLLKGEAGFTSFAAWSTFLFFPGIVAAVLYLSSIGYSRRVLIKNFGLSLLIPLAILIRFYLTKRSESFPINSFLGWLGLWLLLLVGLVAKALSASARVSDSPGQGVDINIFAFWSNLIFALGVFSWLAITPAGAYFSRTGFLFAATIGSIAITSTVFSLLRVKRRFNYHEALSGSVTLAVSLAVFPLFFLSSPNTKGASSFNEAFDAIKLIELADQVYPVKPKDNATVSYISAAVYKREGERLYLVTSDAVFSLCSRSLLKRDSENQTGISTPLAIRINKQTLLPILRMAVGVRGGKLILLEVDARRLKIGRDFTLLRFPEEATVERAAEFQAAGIADGSLSSSAIEIKETSRFSKLSKTRELFFRQSSLEDSSGDFIFCLLPGKGIYWVGVKRSPYSKSDFFPVIASTSLLGQHFKWFDLGKTDLRDVITFYENCLDK
jgi:hypothetical protein